MERKIIEFTGYIDGLGICMDIRFTRIGNEYKTLIPIRVIKRIMPHNEKGWTRIYWGQRESFCIPIEYDEVIELLKTRSLDEVGECEDV